MPIGSVPRKIPRYVRSSNLEEQGRIRTHLQIPSGSVGICWFSIPLMLIGNWMYLLRYFWHFSQSSAEILRGVSSTRHCIFFSYILSPAISTGLLSFFSTHLYDSSSFGKTSTTLFAADQMTLHRSLFTPHSTQYCSQISIFCKCRIAQTAW